MSIKKELIDLVALLTDSQKDHGEAASRVDDPALKERFMRIGNGRAPMIEDLGNELALMGAETPGDGSAKGAIHRAWMEMREAFMGNDAKLLIEECERADRLLLERYDEVIGKNGIPQELKDKLRGHRITLLADLESTGMIKQTMKQ